MSFHESRRSVADDGSLVLKSCPKIHRNQPHPAAKCGSSSKTAPCSLPEPCRDRDCVRQGRCQMTIHKARFHVLGVAFLLAMCLVPPRGVETRMMTSPQS